jgi:poly(3-hydroxybutyrate) depolymerase
MKKLLFILSLLISLVGFSQSAQIVTYNNFSGSQDMQIYYPEGYDAKATWPVIFFYHGNGEKGSVITDVTVSGLPKVFTNGSLSIPCVVVWAQLSGTANSWSQSFINSVKSYAYSQVKEDLTKIYPTGLSLGGEAANKDAFNNPSTTAAYLAVCGNFYIKSGAGVYKDVPSYLVVGHLDPFLAQMRDLVDTMGLQEIQPVLPPLTWDIWGAGHSVWDRVYDDFTPWWRWLNLHDTNKDTTAANYVDSVENASGEEMQDRLTFFWRTSNLVNSLSASAHKTSLLARVDAVFDELYPSGKAVVLEMGLAGQESSGNVNNLTNMATGQSYSNFIYTDGTSSTIDLSILHEGAGTEERDYGIRLGYFLASMIGANGYRDAWWIFGNGGATTNGNTIRFSGLDPTKTYRLWTSGASKQSSTTQQQGVKMIINGVQKQMDNQYYNTTKSICYTGLIPNASGQIDVKVTSYATSNQWEGYLAFFEITEEGIDTTPPPDPPYIIVSTRDTILPIKQTTATALDLKATVTTGTAIAYTWRQLTGNSLVLTNTSTSAANASGFEEGQAYTFEIEVEDLDGNTDKDTMYVRTKNWQKHNWSPKRIGAPVVHELTATSTAADGSKNIVRPYLNRDGWDIQGGDTIKIPGGRYNRIYLGDFGGSPDAKVIIVPKDSAVVMVDVGVDKARFHAGKNSNNTGDSNWIAHAIFDGTYLRDKTGEQFGFDCRGTSWGITGLNINNVTFKGWNFHGTSIGAQIKMYSDSVGSPWSVYDNVVQDSIRILYSSFDSIPGSEGAYIGNTAPSGAQAGNDGPIARMSNIEVAYCFFYHTWWDPVQTSSGRGYSTLHDNIIIKGSQADSSSQNWGILLGGNSSGRIYNNVVFNSTSGTIGTLGYGDVEIDHNAVFGTTQTGSYNSSAISGVLEATDPVLFPPLTLNIHHNLFGDFQTYAIQHANSNQNANPGVIQDNHIVSATGTLSSLIISNANDVINNNTLHASFPVTVTRLHAVGELPSIRVVADGAVDTFSTAAEIYDFLYQELTGTAVNEPPVAGAGIDQSITLPASSVTLAGTATDPDGSVFSTTWTFISGPASPSITNASSLTSTVTGLTTAGQYILRLTVTDDEGSTHTDDITITVTAVSNIKYEINLKKG